MVNVLLDEELYDREFMRTWVDWRGYLRAERPDLSVTFDNFIVSLKALYAQFTPAFAAEETGVEAAQIVEAARGDRPRARDVQHAQLASAAAGNLWGWQITRCLYLLVVLTGSVGTKGGVGLHLSNKFVPKHPTQPPPPEYWNELLFPREYPLAFFEMSFLLPHLLKENRGKLDVYFTRVYNPLWTNPDGFSWMEVLQDTDKIGMHVALSPTWSETAWFADYILPMGLGTERHDTMSQETHAAQWLGFRQPVLRVAREKRGETINATYEANPGEVWEESEFWVALSWKIDPDGALGIRKFFESPYRPGEPITMDEYYGWMFENSVPGLPEAAAKEGLTPLAYMRKYGVFKVKDNVYKPYEAPLHRPSPARDRSDEERSCEGWRPIGVLVDGVPRAGFTTPSRRLEFYSQTLVDWGWPEHAVPRYVPGHVHWRDLKREEGEFDLLPNFRLPTLVHTRSPVKWLYEISHDNPLWIATAGRAAPRHRDRRSRQGAHAHRLLRHARVGDRRHPSRRARHVAPSRTLAPRRRTGQSQRVGARDDRSPGRAATRCRRSTARSRSRAAIPTARASGGARSASTRTSRSRCSPIRSAACTAGISA